MAERPLCLIIHSSALAMRLNIRSWSGPDLLQIKGCACMSNSQDVPNIISLANGSVVSN